MRKRIKQNKSLWIGTIIIFFVSFLAIFAPFIAPYDPNDHNLFMRLRPPSWQEGGDKQHILGTDSLGRDILSRIIFGSRISLLIGFSAVALQGILGTMLGLLSGFIGRWLDVIIMRLVDIQLSIPFLVLALALSAVLGPGVINIVIVLGITGWATYARLARALTIQHKEFTYVQAITALGQKRNKILLFHIFPNISSSIFVTATFQLARMIIAESSLSYLGLGVPLQVTTWGGMIASGRDYITTAWWLSTFPGLALMLTVVGINLLGNALRDIMDPKEK